MSSEETGAAGERADLVQALRSQRRFLRHTTRDLTDEQAAIRTTASELCVGGIVKHVTRVEARWAAFIVEGPSVMSFSEASMQDHAKSFQLLEGETLAEVLEEYEETAARTDALVESLDDLDATQPLPEAPWFPPGARWSARQVVLHILKETAHHSGHADIVREALDGAKTMG